MVGKIFEDSVLAYGDFRFAMGGFVERAIDFAGRGRRR